MAMKRKRSTKTYTKRKRARTGSKTCVKLLRALLLKMLRQRLLTSLELVISSTLMTAVKRIMWNIIFHRALVILKGLVMRFILKQLR